MKEDGLGDFEADEGGTYSGQIVGVAPGTAKVRAHRALKKIRQHMAEEES